MPAVVDLILEGSIHPELITAATVHWDDAAEALAHLEAKTVVIR
jgi:threonine dehydrogenase-like Zn-dependent dehydrogenase